MKSSLVQCHVDRNGRIDDRIADSYDGTRVEDFNEIERPRLRAAVDEKKAEDRSGLDLPGPCAE